MVLNKGLVFVKIFKKGKLSDEDIHKWLVELRPHAYIPESGFAVSVVLRASLIGEDDYYFAGVNVENIDHRLSTHGEEGAIAAMIVALGNQARIAELWAMGAPLNLKPGDKSPYAEACATCCGKCRQQIAGFAANDAKLHYVSLNGKFETTTVGAALPEAFRLPVSAEKPKHSVAATAHAEKNLLRQGPLTQAEIESWLKSLEPVDFISGTSQSIILGLDNGFYVAGTRVEDAAFVDISATQSAVAIAAVAFGTFKITGIWIYTVGKGVSKLPLSALQILLTFVRKASVLLQYLDEVQAPLKLGDAVAIMVKEKK